MGRGETASRRRGSQAIAQPTLGQLQAQFNPEPGVEVQVGGHILGPVPSQSVALKFP